MIHLQKGEEKRLGWPKEEGGLTRIDSAHLQLLLLAQHPQQGHLLLAPGRDTQHLIPAGRHRSHREGALGWGSSTGLENASVVGVERKKNEGSEQQCWAA